MARALSVTRSSARILLKSPWMERLSSTMRMRRFFSGGDIFMGGRVWFQRQLQGERGPVAGAVAVDGKRTADLLGRERAAVQAKAMAVRLGGEAVGENSRQVFRR